MLDWPAFALCCTALLTASGASAQLAPPPAARTDRSASATDEEIVVTGHKAITPGSFDEAVTEFVRDLGRPGPINQISRWGQPVCPTTEGLSPGFNDFVTGRIKEVAARVSAPGSGDCSNGVNVSVMFTTEPDRLMAHVRKHHAGLLGYHHAGERKSLAAFQPPMKSWYVTMTTIPGQSRASITLMGQASQAGRARASACHTRAALRSFWWSSMPV